MTSCTSQERRPHPVEPDLGSPAPMMAGLLPVLLIPATIAVLAPRLAKHFAKRSGDILQSARPAPTLSA